MSVVIDKAKDAAESAGEAIAAVPHELKRSAKQHPRLMKAWTKSQPLLKTALYGAAFVGGGLLLARWFGKGTARRLGEEGGEGFAEGVAKVQSFGRGSRWG